MATDRELLAKLWDEGWTAGLWAASWERSVADLTPEQASWTPANGRHSIWQIVLHMCFWNEDAIRHLKDPTPNSPQRLAEHNFPVIKDASQAAWEATIKRFKASHETIAKAIADPTIKDASRLVYLVPHNSYHIGQINYLRSMMGKPPIE